MGRTVSPSRGGTATRIGGWYHRPMKPEIDLSAAMTYATADPDWVRKSLIAGVVFFIPFVGPFILLGWQKRLVEQALTNPEIPAIHFGPDLTEGLRVFLALLVTTAP